MGLDEGSRGSYLSQQGRSLDLIGRHRILQGASTADLIGNHGILQEGCLGESYLSEHGNSLDFIGRHGMLQEGAREVAIYASREIPLI